MDLDDVVRRVGCSRMFSLGDTVERVRSHLCRFGGVECGGGNRRLSRR